MADMDKFIKYFEQSYQEIVSRDDYSLKTLAERFRQVYDAILSTEIDDYVKGWLLIQAPITIIKPNNNIKVTAFAGDDGRIYINPVFINAIISYIENEVSSKTEDTFKLIADTISYIISHEMSHILLKHVWTAKTVVQETEASKNIPQQLLHWLANVSMDYVINTNICNEFYPSVIDKNILFFGITNYEILETLLQEHQDFIDTKKLFKVDQSENWQNKTWDEIFYEIVSCINTDKIEQNQNFNFIKGLGNKNLSQTDSKDSSQTSRDVSDAHGNKYVFNENDVSDVTEGYLQDMQKSQNSEAQGKQGQSQNPKDIAEQLSGKIAVEFAKKLKVAGTNKGGILRTINENLEVNKNHLKQLLEMFICNRFKTDNKIFSWDKINRRMPYVVPGRRDYSKDKKAIVFFDVSGSMSSKDVDIILSSVKSLVKNKFVTEVVLNTFDDGMIDTFKIKKEKDIVDIKTRIKGGGGTYLSKALRDFNQYNYRDVVMVFTDSELSDSQEELFQETERLKKLTSNNILWFHINPSDVCLHKICASLGNNIIPVKVDFNREKVYFLKLKAKEEKDGITNYQRFNK